MFRVEGQLSLIEKSFFIIEHNGVFEINVFKVFYLQQQRNNFSSEEP